MTMALRFLPAGILFTLTLAFGIWVSRLGKPYNSLLFNVHKLVALGAVIVTALSLRRVLRGMEIQALLIVLMVFAGLCVVALFATGALMSAGNPASRALLVIHQVAPVLLVVSMVAMVTLLGGGRL